MLEVLIASRLVLAAVFVVAAVGKLADMEGSRSAMSRFGVPAGFVAGAAVLLPVLELALAVLLVPAATFEIAALGALALLVSFTVAIAVRLRRGDESPCHCFGTMSSAPVGPWSLARNVGLVALAALVVVDPTGEPARGAFSWVGGLSTAESVAAVNSLLLALVAAGGYALLRQHGRLLGRVDALESALTTAGLALPDDAQAGVAQGLVAGEEAPEFALPDLDGTQRTLTDLLAPGRPVMFVFSDPACGPCRTLMPDIGRWQREVPERLTVAVVTRGPLAANREEAATHGLVHMLVQTDREVAEMYGATVTPTAVLVGADGRVGSAPAAGPDAIRTLVHRASTGDRLDVVHVPPAPSPDSGDGLIGEPLPALELATLAGPTVTLGGARDSDTVLLFWNSACGFCRGMLDDLRRWEEERPEGAPDLVVVAAGDREANGSLELTSPVLLDPEFALGGRLGAGGTPMAVRVDRDGRIASGVVAGAGAFFELVGAPVSAVAEAGR